MTSLGERIRELRLHQEMTQSELARRVGVAQPRISELENGANRNPAIGTLDKIAQALGVPIGILLEAREETLIHSSRVR